MSKTTARTPYKIKCKKWRAMESVQVVGNGRSQNSYIEHYPVYAWHVGNARIHNRSRLRCCSPRFYSLCSYYRICRVSNCTFSVSRYKFQSSPSPVFVINSSSRLYAVSILPPSAIAHFRWLVSASVAVCQTTSPQHRRLPSFVNRQMYQKSFVFSLLLH